VYSNIEFETFMSINGSVSVIPTYHVILITVGQKKKWHYTIDKTVLIGRTIIVPSKDEY